jgi:hypothetical protein
MAELQQVIQLLRSQDTEKRKKAIAWLAKSNDAGALKALAWSAQNDPDPALRGLATKGGQYLQQQMSASSKPAGASALLNYANRSAKEVQQAAADEDDFGYSATSSRTRSADVDDYDSYGGDENIDVRNAYDPQRDGNAIYDDVDALFDDDPEEAAVRAAGSTRGYGADDDDDDVDTLFSIDDAPPDDRSPMKWEAKRALDRAIDHYVTDEYPQALARLLEAIDLDPKAKRDPKALNVAAGVTGLNGGEALRVLSTPEGRARFTGELKGKRGEGKGGRKNESDVGWGQAWTDYGIYTLVNVVGWVIRPLEQLFHSLFGHALFQWGRHRPPHHQPFVYRPDASSNCRDHPCDCLILSHP